MAEFFADEDALADLESALAAMQDGATDAQRIVALLGLAWQLRQRDTHRALLLLDEVERRLASADFSVTERCRVTARVSLIRAEAHWLNARLEAARGLVAMALETFNSINDALGCADAHWLLAMLAHDQGEGARRDRELETMVAKTHGIDPVRCAIAQAAQARFVAFRDLGAANARWGLIFVQLKEELHPAAACWAEDFLAVRANVASDFAQAIRHLFAAYAQALASGQTVRAIIAATNVGDNLNSLNDYDQALEWMQRGLDLARRSGWPGMIGGALMQTANTLRKLQRFDAAREMLREALTLMAPLVAGRNYAIALEYLGKVELGLKDYAAALRTYQLEAERADALSAPDLQSGAQCGQARALLALGQPQQALEAAEAALALGKESAECQIAALRVLADIHATFSLPAAPDPTAASMTLHYLSQALELAAGIEGYTVPGDLLEAVARAYAAAGDTGRAYDYALRAIAARENTHSQEASNRATAMQVTYETARARADAAHHRQLAKTEAERAAALQQSSATVETLGLIGREITASLDSSDVYAALYRHVNQLLDATSFDVYLLEPDGRSLRGTFSIEADQPLPLEIIPLDDPNSFAVRCALERKELVIDEEPGLDDPFLVPGTLDTLSLLFAPLLLGERLLGVISIQSIRRHAYSERERAIFRTLCAYAAIALDNAGAYARAQSARVEADQALMSLREAQERLLRSEKMVALGKVVAGISHELNTPLGNGLMALTTMRSRLADFEAAIGETGLRRSDLEAFTSAVEEGTELALRNLKRSAELVSNFRQLATDRSNSTRCGFRLDEAIKESLASLGDIWRSTPYRVEVSVPEALEMDSYPEAFATTLRNLLANAVTHGFDGRAHGNIQITGEQIVQERIRLQLIDDGAGIRHEDLARIFDPFFTTKLGKGGSGLGLYLAHNLVTQILGGTLAVTSVLGAGSIFILDLPLVAPRD